MIKTEIMIQILFSSVAISCLGQENPPVSIKEILSIGGKGELIRIEEVASDQTGNIFSFMRAIRINQNDYFIFGLGNS